jgi:hypothetical protein
MSTARLLALVAALVALAAGATAALAGRGGDTPPRKHLAQAVGGSLAGGRPAGLVADVRLTNHILDDALPAAAAFVGRADGRLWMAADGRFRLRVGTPFGVVEATSDGRRLGVYVAATRTVYRVALPQPVARDTDSGRQTARLPVRRLESMIRELRGHATVSGPRATTVAGRPAYTVRISPKHDAGLLGGVEVSWDAERAVPLRAAVLAAGQSTPVLELAATRVTYGRVPAAELRSRAPGSARVVQLRPDAALAHAAAEAQTAGGATGAAAVREAIGFRLAAPASLVGLPRTSVRQLRMDGRSAALVTYGRGLGALAVLETSARVPALPLPLTRVSVDGATGTELATPLGTILQVRRHGVSYVLAGSLPAAAAEAAARTLVR